MATVDIFENLTCISCLVKIPRSLDSYICHICELELNICKKCIRKFISFATITYKYLNTTNIIIQVYICSIDCSIEWKKGKHINKELCSVTYKDSIIIKQKLLIDELEQMRYLLKELNKIVAKYMYE